MAREHGVNSSYTNGKCRCASCTYAHNAYQRDWYRRHKEEAAKWRALYETYRALERSKP